MKRAALFDVMSNRIRNTSHRFLMEMQMEDSLKKMWAFLPAGILHPIPCLFHVLTIHGMCPTNRRQ